MLDLIEAEVFPIGRAVILNPFDDKIFLNARDLLLEDEKIASRFIFFSEKYFFFNAKWVSLYHSIDGVDRTLGKEGLGGFNLKADVFLVAEGLGEMK